MSRFKERLDQWSAWFEEWSASRSTLAMAIAVGVSAWTLSMFLYTLQFFPFDLETFMRWGRSADFIKMCTDPLSRDLREPILAYRIVTPGICHILGLRGLPALMMPYILTVFTLAVIYIAAHRHMGSTIAMLVTFGLSFTHLCLLTNNHPGMTDSTTHLLASLSLLFSNMWFAAIMTFFGVLNDERFVLAIPFVLMWHALKHTEMKTGPRRLIVGFTLGLCGAWIVRHALTVGWIGPGIELPQVYKAMMVTLKELKDFIMRHRFWLIVNYFMAFRWLWLIPVAGIFICLKKGSLIKVIFFCGCLLGVMLASTLIWDVSRSIAFAFPAILLSTLYLYEQKPVLCRHLLIMAVVLCVFTPAFFLSPGGMQLYLPLPFVLIREFAGWDIVDLIRTRGHGTLGIH